MLRKIAAPPDPCLDLCLQRQRRLCWTPTRYLHTKKAQTESSAANLQEGMERKEPGAEAVMIVNASSKEPAGCGGYLENQRAPRLCSCLDLCPPGPTSCSVEKKNPGTAVVAQGRLAATPDRAPRGRFGPSPPHLDCGICKRDLFCL